MQIYSFINLRNLFLLTIIGDHWQLRRPISRKTNRNEDVQKYCNIENIRTSYRIFVQQCTGLQYWLRSVLCTEFHGKPDSFLFYRDLFAGKRSNCFHFRFLSPRHKKEAPWNSSNQASLGLNLRSEFLFARSVSISVLILCLSFQISELKNEADFIGYILQFFKPNYRLSLRYSVVRRFRAKPKQKCPHKEDKELHFRYGDQLGSFVFKFKRI